MIPCHAMPNPGHRSSCWGQRPKINGSDPIPLRI
nr:MAG TPA: hypothetical protein [Caudoviricetes sp.]